MAKFVVYSIPSQKRADTLLFSSQSQHEPALQGFIQKHPQDDFLRIEENDAHPDQWRQLRAAIDLCKQHNAPLVIPRVSFLLRNEKFSNILLDLIKTSNVEVYILDQPNISRQNLPAIIEHEKHNRALHSQAIKEGIERSQTSSGNPHANDLLKEINLPKTLNAIMFAILFKPVVDEYVKQGLAQRKMVEALNAAQFHAPEGGDWVLSQFQKILQRVKLTNAALILESSNLATDDEEAMIAALNDLNLSPIKGESWTPEMVQDVKTHLEHINAMMTLNEFMVEVCPNLSEMPEAWLEEDIVKAAEEVGVKIPEHWQENVHQLLDCIKKRVESEIKHRQLTQHPQYDTLAETHCQTLPQFTQALEQHLRIASTFPTPSTRTKPKNH